MLANYLVSLTYIYINININIYIYITYISECKDFDDGAGDHSLADKGTNLLAQRYSNNRERNLKDKRNISSA